MTMNWKATLSMFLATAVYAEEPCSPRLLPMTTTRVPVFDEAGNPTGMMQTVSAAETATRRMTVYYRTPEVVGVGPFVMEGDVEIDNLSNGTRTVKYRQSVKIGEGMVPIIPLGSGILCWEVANERLVADYSFTVDPMATLAEGIDWTVSIRRADQIADINGDGWVDSADQGLLFAAWGTNNPEADLNFDGTVNGTDLGVLFSQWSESSEGS